MPITPPLVVWSPIWRFALLIFLLVITARLLARPAPAPDPPFPFVAGRSQAPPPSLPPAPPPVAEKNDVSTVIELVEPC
jgi:hypothetical protein